MTVLSAVSAVASAVEGLANPGLTAVLCGQVPNRRLPAGFPASKKATVVTDVSSTWPDQVGVAGRRAAKSRQPGAPNVSRPR